jgi:hypothetical protein
VGHNSDVLKGNFCVDVFLSGTGRDCTGHQFLNIRAIQKEVTSTKFYSIPIRDQKHSH